MTRIVQTIGTSLLIVAACAFAADKPNPGLYEVTTQMDYTDLPIPATTLTTKNCLTAEDLEGDLSRIFADLPEDQNCEVESFSMADGSISMKLVCATPEGSMTMSTQGSYDSDSYSMTSNVTMEAAGRQMQMNSTIEGVRLGDC